MSRNWKAFLASFDAGKDGVISKEKLSSLLPRRRGGGRQGGRRGAPGERFTRMLDRNGNDKIEIEDLNSILKELDRNGDGIIGRDEVGRRGGSSAGGALSGNRGRVPSAMLPVLRAPRSTT